MSTEPFLVTARGARGLSADQLRGPGFVRPSRGVRIPTPTPDPERAMRSAAILAAPPAAVLADVAAARVWGLPLPPRIGLHIDDHPVTVAVPPDVARPQRRGVRGRRLRLPPEHVTEVAGQRVTTPARTWIDCAELVALEPLVAMGDFALHEALATPMDLRTMVGWARRRRGVVNARYALTLVDARAESPGESLVRVHLMLGSVPQPECNIDIVVRGEWLARADLAWPAQRVIVEYDGLVHLDEQRRRSDAQRRNLLQEAGWLVIVFTAADLKRPWTMAPMVLNALRARS